MDACYVCGRSDQPRLGHLDSDTIIDLWTSWFARWSIANDCELQDLGYLDIGGESGGA